MRYLSGPISKFGLEDLLARDHTLNAGVVQGLQGSIIEVQARAMTVFKKPREWSDAVYITGLARNATAESVSRIQGAFAKLRIPNPQVEIRINLAPADVPKESSSLDLAIAIVMLQASGYLPDLPEAIEGDYVLVGEVGLHGELRRVRGVLSIAEAASPHQTLIVPIGNEKECAIISLKENRKACQVAAVGTLQEVIEFFAGERRLENVVSRRPTVNSAVPRAPDFAVIKGQRQAKEAAVIAAAGGHNLLLIGPPGEGKSLLAHATAGILPPLSPDEIVELTRIYSAAGAIANDGAIVNRRPFRAVHPTASKQSLVGGGSYALQPGEITLAHLGILFLDELPEFRRDALESLRQPMEDGVVTVTRVKARATFPARFTLIAAMNPCPCGYYGTAQCRCTEREVASYQARISGPLLDRIDLKVEMDRLTVDERFSQEAGPGSKELRERVVNARKRQTERFAGMEIPFNAAIPPGRIRELCQFSPRGFETYKRVVAESSISTRTTDRLAKVARTVADLEGSDSIEPPHVEKAVQFVFVL
ncbi:MAG: YifB family Mg chelatase-like AAA ATPase [Thermogutta sp.]|nr:YifB family Mg chelatase-like AAA ATPase [Thermogutta sp.]